MWTKKAQSKIYMASPDKTLLAIIDDQGRTSIHSESGVRVGPIKAYSSQQEAEEAFEKLGWTVYLKADASVFSNPEFQRSDENKGENGEFSEPAVVDRKKKWAPTDGKAGDPVSMVPGTPGTCCPSIVSQ
jgi:hypothetical protein